MVFNPLTELPNQLGGRQSDCNVDVLGEGEDLLEDPGHDGVLVRQNVPAHRGHHVEGGLQLVPLAGLLELAVHLAEDVAAAHDKDTICNGEPSSDQAQGSGEGSSPLINSLTLTLKSVKSSLSSSTPT